MQSTRHMEERLNSASAIHHDSAGPAESQKAKSSESWTRRVVGGQKCFHWKCCFLLEIELCSQVSMFLSNYRSRRFWNSLILLYQTSNGQKKQKDIFSHLWTGHCIVYAVPHLYISKSRIFKYKRTRNANNQMQNLLFLKIK